jgi:hypothetical protein
MLAPIGRNAGVEDVVVAPLDDVDRVDLQVAQVRDRGGRGRRARAERLSAVQALGVQPEVPRLGGGEADGQPWDQSPCLWGSRSPPTRSTSSPGVNGLGSSGTSVSAMSPRRTRSSFAYPDTSSIGTPG